MSKHLVPFNNWTELPIAARDGVRLATACSSQPSTARANREG
jgi:hypothetical protein